MKKIAKTLVSTIGGVASGLVCGSVTNVIARKIGVDEFTNCYVTGAVTIGTTAAASASIYGKLPGDENPSREPFGKKGKKTTPDKLADKVLKDIED